MPARLGGKSLRKSAILLVASLALAGCFSPEQYESEPVVLKTKQGPVVCQLYTKERIDWDRAIQWPRGISQEKADGLCLEEGIRLMRS